MSADSAAAEQGQAEQAQAEQAQADFEQTLVDASGGNPEVEISRDLAKRGLLLGPVLIVVCGLIWGMDGALSSAVAVVLVILNFVWTAAMMAAASRISVGALMGSVLFGYLLRLGLILLAFLLVRNESWFSVVPFGIAIIVTHLGLLAWELRYVSLTLAYPGLKPTKSTS